MEAEVLVIDPAVETPEIDSFNLIVRMSPLAATYHLPALQGFDSLQAGSQAKTVAGIVLLGSKASVHDRLEWQERLTGWLQAHLLRGTPFLGICYGHQLLAHMYGAQVGFLAGPKRLGQREIQLSADPRLGLEKACSGPMVVSHREVVQGPVDGFDIFASSAEFALEGLRHPTLPVWSLQGHPEAGMGFCRARGLPLGPEDLGFGWDLVRRFLQYTGAR